MRRLSSVLIALGLLLLLDAALTLAWQEPATALYAHVRQGALRGDLGRLERAAVPAPERRALASIPGDGARTAYLARSLAARVRDGQALGRIQIPRIHASYVVVQGVSGGDLRAGPGHYPSSALPGMAGTVAIAGHRTTYLAPFRDIDQLRPDDEVRLEMPYATVSYRVERTRIVDPSATWVTRAVGYPRLVLTACHPRFSAAKRIVVFARQVSARIRSARAGSPRA